MRGSFIGDDRQPLRNRRSQAMPPNDLGRVCFGRCRPPRWKHRYPNYLRTPRRIALRPSRCVCSHPLGSCCSLFITYRSGINGRRERTGRRLLPSANWNKTATPSQGASQGRPRHRGQSASSAAAYRRTCPLCFCARCSLHSKIQP